MIVADSSVWTDYFKGVIADPTETLHARLAEELVVIGDLILAEVLQGFRKDRDFDPMVRHLGLKAVS